MSRPLSEALEGLAGTAGEWAGTALDHAAAVVLRLDDETYASDADALAVDLATSAALVVRGWAQMGGALLEAAVKVAMPPVPVRRVGTERFTVLATGGRRTLMPVGRAWASPADGGMGTWRVRFDPPELLEGEDRFRMVVDATDLDGTAYLGTVSVVDSSGAEIERVPVVVQVP